MRMERGILEERCRSGLLWEKLEGILFLFLFAGIMRKRKGGRRSLDGAQADVATVGRKDGTGRRARRLAAGAVGDAPGDFFFFFSVTQGMRAEIQPAIHQTKRPSVYCCCKRSHLRAAYSYCRRRIQKEKPAVSLCLRGGGLKKSKVAGRAVKNSRVRLDVVRQA